MKSNEPDIGIERERGEAELPELAARILSDFARIAAAEARLLEANILGAAQALVDRVYAASLLVALAASGVVAILASIALLLHNWMKWWQVLGLVGICAMIVAEALRRSLISSPVSSPPTGSEPHTPTTDTQR